MKLIEEGINRRLEEKRRFAKFIYAKGGILLPNSLKISLKEVLELLERNSIGKGLEF